MLSFLAPLSSRSPSYQYHTIRVLQARMVFSTYLQRVCDRLILESRGSIYLYVNFCTLISLLFQHLTLSPFSSPACPLLEYVSGRVAMQRAEHIDLVLRFLKRAAAGLPPGSFHLVNITNSYSLEER
jgi:hypothetical protein